MKYRMNVFIEMRGCSAGMESKYVRGITKGVRHAKHMYVACKQAGTVVSAFKRRSCAVQ